MSANGKTIKQVTDEFEISPYDAHRYSVTIPFRPPHSYKIDVEGAEMRVLEGGEETISIHRPGILIEGPRELWEKMGSFFQKLDYVLLDGAAEVQVPLTEPVWDTIAVPKEKFTRPQRYLRS